MPLTQILAGAFLLIAVVLGALLLKRALFWVGIRIARRLAAKLDMNG